MAMATPDEDLMTKDVDTQCKAHDEICDSSTDMIDTLHMLIENQHRDILFLREQLTVKNHHIDSLLDIVEKYTSAKSVNHDQIIINPTSELTEGIENSIPQKTPELTNLNTPFLLPKKTCKSAIENSKSDIIQSNRFGGLWLEESDDLNFEIDNIDGHSNCSDDSETTMYSDIVRQNLNPSSLLKQVEDKPSTVTANQTVAQVHNPSSQSKQVNDKPSTATTNQTTALVNNRRPQVVVNQKPETERFESAKHDPKPDKKQKPLVAIVGDSMIKWVTSYDIRSTCNHAKVLVRPFLGACINDLYDYLKPVLKCNPQVIVLHISTNDASSHDFINMETICQDMELLIKELNELGIVVVLSLPINRTDEYSDRVKDLNIMLRSLCAKLLVNYIDNNNIKHHHLNGSGLHLNKEGTSLLCQNIAIFLDFLIPKCFLN